MIYKTWMYKPLSHSSLNSIYNLTFLLMTLYTSKNIIFFHFNTISFCCDVPNIFYWIDILSMHNIYISRWIIGKLNCCVTNPKVSYLKCFAYFFVIQVIFYTLVTSSIR